MTPTEHRWTLLHSALACVILTYVWRVQDLVAVLRTLQFVSLVSLAALGLALAGGAASRMGELWRHPAFRCAVFIMGWTVLSVPGGVYPGQTFSFIYQDFIKTFLIFIVLTAAVRTFRHAERLAAVHVVGGMVYALYVLKHFQIGSDGRLGSLIHYDANDLGMLLVCTLPLAVYFVWRRGMWPMRVVGVVAIGVFIRLIVESGSRGAFLGLLAVGAYLLLQFRAFRPGTRFAVVGTAAALLVLMGSDKYWEMIGTLLHPSQDYNWAGGASAGRMEVWKRGIGYMLTHPVLGVGAGAFYAAEGMLSPGAALQSLGVGLKWSAAHNSFVQIGAELGVPGLAAFVAMLVQSFRSTLRLGARRPGERAVAPEQALAQALTATLIAFCVSGFFLSQAYSVFLYTVLALVIGLALVPAEEAAPVPVARAPRRRGGGWGPVRTPPMLPPLAGREA